MPTTYQTIQAAIAQARPFPFSAIGQLLKGDKRPVAITVKCDFGATGIPADGYYFDATQLIQMGAIAGIQSVFVDNTGNNANVTVSNPSFNQVIAIPQGYQGIVPILAAEGSGNKFYITSPTGTGQVIVQFLNVLLPLAIWAGINPPTTSGIIQPVSDAILEALVIGGRFNTRQIEAQCTDVDHSGSLAAGNTSQLLMAANPNRRGYRIQNIDPNFPAEALWVNTAGAAAVIGGSGSFGLAACASIGYPGGSIDGKSSAAIHIIGLSAGHLFSAIEW